MIFPSLLLDATTSSGVFLKSAYKTPANFNEFQPGKRKRAAQATGFIAPAIALSSACVTQRVLQSF